MKKNISKLAFVFLSSSFQNANSSYPNIELHFNEHFDEIRQRIFHIFTFFFLVSFLSFFNIKVIVKILQEPISDIHFFQLSPGEYFVSTLVIAMYMGLLFSIPLTLWQLLFFFQPALNSREKKIINWLLVSSICLFFLGLLFSYFLLIPAALKFFINYSSEVIEPFWSFNQYFEFISTLFFSTGLIFQIPIIQIILSLFNIIDPKIMLNIWRPIVLLSSIISAIITPSADPITQLLLTGALFFLYIVGNRIAILLTSTEK